MMHSSPNASFAVMTTESNFMQNFGKQKVNGSHFTKAFITLCTNATGKLVHITVGAAVSPWYALSPTHRAPPLHISASVRACE